LAKKQEIVIRKAEPADLVQVYDLIRELAIYEKAPDQPSNPLKKFIEDGTCKHPRYFVIVAECGDEIVGMALYYNAYSTWKGTMIYLDDLVVREKYRKHGIGKKLMDELISIAKEEKVCQLRWQVLDWNEPAINFYKKYPVIFDKEWITVKIERKDF
jgi:GNAT superfamily N-acetyltransferase